MPRKPSRRISAIVEKVPKNKSGEFFGKLGRILSIIPKVHPKKK